MPHTHYAASAKTQGAKKSIGKKSIGKKSVSYTHLTLPTKRIV